MAQDFWFQGFESQSLTALASGWLQARASPRPSGSCDGCKAKSRNSFERSKTASPASVVKDALIALEAQQSELKARLDRVAQPAPLLHPNMANLYREKVVQPAPGLQFEESRIAAAAAWSLGR
jgi:hypothetical protein